MPVTFFAGVTKKNVSSVAAPGSFFVGPLGSARPVAGAPGALRFPEGKTHDLLCRAGARRDPCGSHFQGPLAPIKSSHPACRGSKNRRISPLRKLILRFSESNHATENPTRPPVQLESSASSDPWGTRIAHRPGTSIAKTPGKDDPTTLKFLAEIDRAW